MQPDLRKQEREKIFSIFQTQEKLKFSQIEKHLAIRSNMVSYHLECMIKDKALVKKGEFYSLTQEAERYLPYHANPSALPVVLVAIMNDSKVLLWNRVKRPYKDMWGLIGGRLLHGESLEQATVRLAKEKAGLDVEFEKICSMAQEHVVENEATKHSFLLILTKVHARGILKDNNCGWFSLKDAAKLDIIPSDLHLLKTRLAAEMQVDKFELLEVDGRVSDFKLVDSNIFK